MIAPVCAAQRVGGFLAILKRSTFWRVAPNLGVAQVVTVAVDFVVLAGDEVVRDLVSQNIEARKGFDGSFNSLKEET